MAVATDGGKSKPLTAAQKAANKRTDKVLAAKSAAKKTKKKITPEQFAINQLRKAGIKPTKTGDVKAQFRAANLKAKKRRVKQGLGRASTVGASSALAAGFRTANPATQQGRAAVIKTTKTEPRVATSKTAVSSKAVVTKKPAAKKKTVVKKTTGKKALY